MHCAGFQIRHLRHVTAKWLNHTTYYAQAGVAKAMTNLRKVELTKPKQLPQPKIGEELRLDGGVSKQFFIQELSVRSTKRDFSELFKTSLSSRRPI